MNKIKIFNSYPSSNFTLQNQIDEWLKVNSVTVISAQTSISVYDNSIYLICTVVYADDEVKL